MFFYSAGAARVAIFTRQYIPHEYLFFSPESDRRYCVLFLWFYFMFSSRRYNKAKQANTTARASLQSKRTGFDLGFDLARNRQPGEGACTPGRGPAHGMPAALRMQDPHTDTAGAGAAMTQPTQHPARRPCPQCGEIFQPFKPGYTVCIDCHMAAIRAAVIERGTLATGKRVKLGRPQANPRQGRNTPAVIGE
jgi:hypothetical protein